MRKCAICGEKFEKFQPIEQKYIELPIKYGREKKVRPETLNSKEYSCPFCYSVDMDRMIAMFLKMIHAELSNGINILEIAPSGALQRYVYKEWGKSNLYTADLFMDEVDYKVDIQDMQNIDDGEFDFIVCSHVLEHVKDDRKAMRELYRVLDKRGLGIIIVPLDLNQQYIDEEWGLSEAENFRRFGQGDHVRAYSKNQYIERLKDSGFGVHQIDKEFFSKKEFDENALTETSTLYLVYKSSCLYKKKENIVENFKKAHENNEIEKLFPINSSLCNQWIDLCKIENDILKIWGWVYFIGKDSTRTKFKLMLKGENYSYIFGVNIRKRPDIQENFGTINMDYSYSGIDISLTTDKIKPDVYEVYICLTNGNERQRIEVAKNICIHEYEGE